MNDCRLTSGVHVTLCKSVSKTAEPFSQGMPPSDHKNGSLCSLELGENASEHKSFRTNLRTKSPAVMADCHGFVRLCCERRHVCNP
jgi:hypothetical protein